MTVPGFGGLEAGNGEKIMILLKEILELIFSRSSCKLEGVLDFAYLEAPHMLNGHVFGFAVARLQIFVQRGKNLKKRKNMIQ